MSDEDVIDRDAALSSLPPEWKGDGNGAGDGAGDGGRAGGGVEAGLARTIAARVAGDDQTIVVLDDDPTGTQTVYDLPVLTVWSEAALDAEFGRGTPAFYVMTNSRSMGQEEAAAVGRAIAGRLRAAAARHGRRLSVISRSDSTLRGHYPLEIDVLAEALSGDSGDSGATTAANAANANAIDGQILVPFFLEGGRLTLDDVHYVAEGDRLVPAAQTPFARDHAFGFTRSNLRDYVEEKTGGRIGRDDVESITLDDLRTGGPTRVRAKLSALRNMCACIVNAVTMRDVQVFALGLLDAEARDGRRFLVRSAASFVQARIGLPKRPILDAGRIRSKGGGAGAHGTGAGGGANGGLVVVGSYVPKTTRQLEELLRLDGVLKVEVAAADLVDEAKRPTAIDATLAQVEAVLASGRDAVVYTSRDLVTGATPAESLRIGNGVSDGLVSIVSRLTIQPSFIIAKGGITSSDVATKGLGIRRAMVLGQAAPGIPVWQIGEEGKFPGMSFVVFPGNVGTDDALAKLVKSLSR